MPVYVRRVANEELVKRVRLSQERIPFEVSQEWQGSQENARSRGKPRQRVFSLRRGFWKRYRFREDGNAFGMSVFSKLGERTGFFGKTFGESAVESVDGESAARIAKPFTYAPVGVGARIRSEFFEERPSFGARRFDGGKLKRYGGEFVKGEEPKDWGQRFCFGERKGKFSGFLPVIQGIGKRFFRKAECGLLDVVVEKRSRLDEVGRRDFFERYSRERCFE